MAFKFIAIFALIAVASAGIIPNAQIYHAAPAAQVYNAAPAAIVKTQPIFAKTDEEYDPHPQYKFGYDVQDAVSGDTKSQVEERDGDVVRGEYSLIDSDGYKRTVHYTADPINGFNAVVNREPLAVKTIVKTGAPVAHYAAPAYTTYSAPTVVKSFAPAYTSHLAPNIVKSVGPAYNTYSAPATYITHH